MPLRADRGIDQIASQARERLDAGKQGHTPQQRLTKAPRQPGRSQTSIIRLSRSDFGRPALKEVSGHSDCTASIFGGRYGYRPGLHRLRDHPQEVDLLKPVLRGAG